MTSNNFSDSLPNSQITEECALIVPLYNEGTVIHDVITRVKPIFPHIICVDDGSNDNSSYIAFQAGATVLRHSINLGQGAALQTGFCWFISQTNLRFAITFDADGQHRPQDAMAMANFADQHNLGYVLGSRFMQGPNQAGWLKKLVLKLVTKTTNWRTGLQLTDAHNGIRLLRRDVIQQIELRQNRMAHASEIIKQIAHSKAKGAEFPVTIDYTEYSKAKGQSLLNGVNIITEMLFG